MNAQNSADITADSADHVVRLRGLPWSANYEDVSKFLQGCRISGGAGGTHFTFTRDGRPSGEVYVELVDDEDVQKALTKNNEHIGRRYIEVFAASRSEMDWVVKRSGPDIATKNCDAVVRLRGLPFDCSKEEIAHFFSGLQIIPNGITLLADHQGRASGDAYVQFSSQDIAERALEKHKEKLGHRYVEVFRSTHAEVEEAMAQQRKYAMMSIRPGPYNRMGRGSLRGMMASGGRGKVKGLMDHFGEDMEMYGSRYGGGGDFGFGRSRMGMGMSRMGMGFGMEMGGRGFRGSGRFSDRGRGRGGKRSSEPEIDHVSQTGHSIHMRGLPFAAKNNDIELFFSPLKLVNIVIHHNRNGLATGEADVDFPTHQDAVEAMKKDKASMHHRYIELFLNSKQTSTGGGYTNYSASYNTGISSTMQTAMSSHNDMGLPSYSSSAGNAYAAMDPTPMSHDGYTGSTSVYRGGSEAMMGAATAGAMMMGGGGSMMMDANSMMSGGSGAMAGMTGGYMSSGVADYSTSTAGYEMASQGGYMSY